ncbi:MAG: hypothetical protein PHE24_06190 [Patescibacteria group bacterium]|nr:hypothetical protein [Patescibacteria group bacterium]
MLKKSTEEKEISLEQKQEKELAKSLANLSPNLKKIMEESMKDGITGFGFMTGSTEMARGWSKGTFKRH